MDRTKEAWIYFKAGKGQDGYFDRVDLCEQTELAIELHEDNFGGPHCWGYGGNTMVPLARGTVCLQVQKVNTAPIPLHTPKQKRLVLPIPMPFPKGMRCTGNLKSLRVECQAIRRIVVECINLNVSFHSCTVFGSVGGLGNYATSS